MLIDLRMIAVRKIGPATVVDIDTGTLVCTARVDRGLEEVPVPDQDLHVVCRGQIEDSAHPIEGGDAAWHRSATY